MVTDGLVRGVAVLGRAGPAVLSAVDLDRRVQDPVSAQGLVDGADGLVVGRRAVDREGSLAVADAPDVQVVDVVDAGNGRDRVVDLLPVDACRGFLQEDRDGALQDAGGRPEDQPAKDEGQDRVDRVPLRLEPNHEAWLGLDRKGAEREKIKQEKKV